MFDLADLTVILFLGFVPGYFFFIGSKRGGYYDLSSGQYASTKKAFAKTALWVIFVALIVNPIASNMIRQIYASYPRSELFVFGFFIIFYYILFSTQRPRK